MDTFPGCKGFSGSFDRDLELNRFISGSTVVIVSSVVECNATVNLLLLVGTGEIHAFVIDVSAQTVAAIDAENFTILATLKIVFWEECKCLVTLTMRQKEVGVQR
jgi:hypothetical protein